MRWLPTLVACICLFFALPTITYADGVTYSQTWAGIGDMFDRPLGHNPGVFGTELGVRGVSHPLEDILGLASVYWITAVEGSPGFLYSHTGIRVGLMIPGVEFSVGLSVGYFTHLSNQWQDLGSALLFKEDIQIRVPFDCSNVGPYWFFGISHLSNAGTGDNNPGTEILFLGIGAIL